MKNKCNLLETAGLIIGGWRALRVFGGLRDDGIIRKMYDSKKDGRARFTPHSAFSTDNDYGPPRKSIEVRCFVFWEDQHPE